MAATGATVPPATFDLIATWIGQQQQASTPLTDKLRTALLGLESAIAAEPAPQLEPELGEHNWIGLLQEYRAAYRTKGTQELKFTETEFVSRGVLRWKCQVTIDEAPGVAFPCADESLLSFARKKDAKKYASKCAVEWLRAKGHMPENGVRFPKGFIPPHQQQQQQQIQSKSQQPQTSTSPPTQGGQTPSPAKKPPSPPAKLPSSPFDDSQPSAANQVTELCKALGITPPKYDIEATGDGFYKGRADFGPSGDLLPFDVSQLTNVENVMGKKPAKEMIAEDLLKHLQELKQTRDAANRAFLEGGNE
ncbi:hypothetical protein F5Y12DRAFT_727275 [Xylaria sp. FL1777]|nr:hypothetical protein F5Y12DRAFT_727275 [Xylaria sp. FL1777]